MVKARRELVLLSAFLSGIGTILTFLSLFTRSWIVSKGEFIVGEPIGGQPPSEINYGLFHGNLNQKYGSTTNFPLTVTCLISHNVCAYLCKTTSEQRSSELTGLYNGQEVSFDPTCAIPVRNQVVMTVVDRRKHGFKSKSEREFINAGLYYSTLVFVCLSGIFGGISTGVSVWNVVDNPIEVVFSFIGLYVYNSVASVASLLALVLWAIQYLATLQENIGILYTIMGQMNTNGLAGLGYSYWLNLPACLLYASSIFLLYLRQYLVNQDPKSKIHLPLTSSGNGVGDIVY